MLTITARDGSTRKVPGVAAKFYDDDLVLVNGWSLGLVDPSSDWAGLPVDDSPAFPAEFLPVWERVCIAQASGGRFQDRLDRKWTCQGQGNRATYGRKSKVAR